MKNFCLVRRLTNFNIAWMFQIKKKTLTFYRIKNFKLLYLRFWECNCNTSEICLHTMRIKILCCYAMITMYKMMIMLIIVWYRSSRQYLETNYILLTTAISAVIGFPPISLAFPDAMISSLSFQTFLFTYFKNMIIWVY